MLYNSAEDFYNQVSNIKRISREEEINCAQLMKENNNEARQMIVNSYLIVIAARIKRLPKEYQSLELIYRCIDVLEKAVDTFNFFQDGETFMHSLCIRLQSTVTRYVVDK